MFTLLPVFPSTKPSIHPLTHFMFLMYFKVSFRHYYTSLLNTSTCVLFALVGFFCLFVWGSQSSFPPQKQPLFWFLLWIHLPCSIISYINRMYTFNTNILICPFVWLTRGCILGTMNNTKIQVGKKGYRHLWKERWKKRPRMRPPHLILRHSEILHFKKE